MRGFGRRRRPQGARRTKAARPAPSQRPPDAALGREMRSLLGPARGGRASAARSVSAPGRRISRPRWRLPVGRLRGGRLVTPARAAGLLGMLGAGFLFTFVTGPSAFAVSRVDAPTLEWTSDAAVRSALALPNGTNVFELDTAPIEAALRALPGVATADVRVALPDASLLVTITERVPVLAWQAGDTRFLADAEGVIFATIPATSKPPAGVAVVEDRRAGAAGRYAVGGRLDPVDLDVATRLGSLTPADVGSAASRLRVSVTDTDGFLVSVDKGWLAVFGFYSPATRPADMIPGQVRLLRSLLAGQEANVQRVVLASEAGGTFIPKATPRPSKK